MEYEEYVVLEDRADGTGDTLEVSIHQTEGNRSLQQAEQTNRCIPRGYVDTAREAQKHEHLRRRLYIQHRGESMKTMRCTHCHMGAAWKVGGWLIGHWCCAQCTVKKHME